MRYKLIIIAILILASVSCKPSNKKKDYEMAVKQASIYKLLAKEKQDSIILVEQERAIGEIKFGMTKSVVKMEIEKFKQANIKATPGKPYDSSIYIGEFQVFQILDFYYEEKLYDLLIQGTPIMWKNYDVEIPRQVYLITEVIEQKYGNPTQHFDIEPRHKLQEGYTYLINRWNIGKKRIEVRIENYGPSYIVNVNIFLPEIEKKIGTKKTIKEKVPAEKAKKLF